MEQQDEEENGEAKSMSPLPKTRDTNTILRMIWIAQMVTYVSIRHDFRRSFFTSLHSTYESHPALLLTLEIPSLTFLPHFVRM